MAGYNRHLRGDTNVMNVRVKGDVAVESGDLMFLNNDNYAAPFTYIAGTASSKVATTGGYVKEKFMGVAVEGSPSGSTEWIGIAQSGVMRFPLVSAGAVTVGAKVSAVSQHPAAAGVSDQYVTNSIAGAIHGTTGYLGYIIKTESGASYVDFQMRTAFGPGGIVT